MCWENGKWTSCLSPYNVICIGHSPCMSGEVSEILAIHPRSSMGGKCQCDKLGRPLSLCRNKSTYQILLDIFLTIFFLFFGKKTDYFLPAFSAKHESFKGDEGRIFCSSSDMTLRRQSLGKQLCRC